MADGDIEVQFDEDGGPTFRMEGVPPALIEEIVPGRPTGLRDIDGIPLFDGDEVLNLNVPGRWDPHTLKRGEPGAIGRVRLTHCGPYTFWTAAGASIETISAHPEFGVRKLPR